MKQIPWRFFQLLLLPVLLALVTFVGTNRSAFALVKSQATNVISPGQTFCLPVQQISVDHKGEVVAGGFSNNNETGAMLSGQWTIYDGPTSTNLHVIAQLNTSFTAAPYTVPIGSFFQTCLTDTHNVAIAFSMEQDEAGA